jgi:hypothetical protein
MTGSRRSAARAAPTCSAATRSTRESSCDGRAAPPGGRPRVIGVVNLTKDSVPDGEMHGDRELRRGAGRARQ